MFFCPDSVGGGVINSLAVEVAIHLGLARVIEILYYNPFFFLRLVPFIFYNPVTEGYPAIHRVHT